MHGFPTSNDCSADWLAMHGRGMKIKNERTAFAGALTFSRYIHEVSASLDRPYATKSSWLRKRTVTQDGGVRNIRIIKAGSAKPFRWYHLQCVARARNDVTVEWVRMSHDLARWCSRNRSEESSSSCHEGLQWSRRLPGAEPACGCLAVPRGSDANDTNLQSRSEESRWPAYISRPSVHRRDVKR